MASGLMRVLLFSLLMTSAVLLVGAEEPIDDVDRTDFTEEHLKEDPVAMGPMGPHSEVEPASLLPDLPDSKVPIGIPSFMLCSLANSGGKMFNVSAITGSLQDASGKELQTLTKKEYGEPLGPREQRSFRFGFVPDKETPPGDYKLVFQVYYNNRDKDQFNDTVFDEAVALVPPPPSLDAQLKLIQAGIGGVFVIIVLIFLSSRGGKAASDGKPAAKAKGAKQSAVEQDEWLASTLAGTENREQKSKGGRKPKKA